MVMLLFKAMHSMEARMNWDDSEHLISCNKSFGIALLPGVSSNILCVPFELTEIPLECTDIEGSSPRVLGRPYPG